MGLNVDLLINIFYIPHLDFIVFCISEVIDISPRNLDSILCFFQPSVSHDVHCI